MANTEEFQNGVSVGTLGEVLIRYITIRRKMFDDETNIIVLFRCNNVLYIRGNEEDNDVNME